MVELPPDLARLGDELAAAARRRTVRRERRRRATVAIAVGALAFAALTPAALEPAQRELAIAGGVERPGCDRPRGTGFVMVACEGSRVLNRPHAWPSYS
jgi:hypothetical protein